MKYKITERDRENRAAPRFKPQKKKLTKLNRAHKKRRAGLERVGYDPKSVEIFGGIVE